MPNAEIAIDLLAGQTGNVNIVALYPLSEVFSIGL